MTDPAQDAAAGIIDDVFADTFSEETDEAAEPEGEAEQQQEDGPEIPDINWEVPEELQEVLDSPDFDEEEEVQEFEGEGNVNYDQEDDFQDPEQLQRQLKKLQKQLRWEQEQKTKQGRKLWADEARKYFQFSNPEVIQAKSRRAFLKEAQRQHEAVAKVAKPVFDQLAEEKKKIREEALAEARAQAEQMWGRPTTGPTGVQNIGETTQSVQRKRLESSRGLTQVLKDKLKTGEVKL